MAKKSMPATTKFVAKAPQTPAHMADQARRKANQDKAAAAAEASKKKDAEYQAMKLNNRLGRGKRGY